MAPHALSSRGGMKSEFHARRLFQLRTRLGDVEEFALLETERPGDERGRKLLDAGVVFLHGVVEEASRRRELVLDVGKVRLQLLEIVAGLQVGIGFREREELAQG